MRSPCRLLVLLGGLGLVACGGGGDAVDGPPGDVSERRFDASAIDAPGPDAGPADAGGADAPPPVVIYGLIAGKLVWLDAATGALTEVGDGPPDARFAWDPSVGLMYVLLSPLSNPSLGIIDLCTGEIGPGPALTRGGVQVPKAEGFARHPTTGAWSVCIDADGSAPTVYASETLGALALDSGIVTSVGVLDTFTDDCDTLTFIGTTLHAIDVDQPNGRTGLYAVDPASAATTFATMFDDDVVRVTWDPSRSLLFGHTHAGRELVTVDPATGAVTPIGETHGGSLPYGSNPFTALAPAPLASCPAI